MVLKSNAGGGEALKFVNHGRTWWQFAVLSSQLEIYFSPAFDDFLGGIL